MHFARGETFEDPAVAIAAARLEGASMATVGAMGVMSAASDLAQQAAAKAAADVDANAAVREEAAEQRRREAAEQRRQEQAARDEAERRQEAARDAAQQQREEAAAREQAARDAAEERRQEAAREAAREAAAQQALQHAAVLSAVKQSSTAASRGMGHLLDELSGVERNVRRMKQATLPIADSVARLAVQVQAQAQPAACARPGMRARPAGNVAGNDENRPPMRFGLGTR